MSARVQLEDWAFLSGVTAVAETRLLTNDELLDLMRLPTLEALFQHLKQVETYVELTRPESADEATRTVEREFVLRARKIRAQCPDGRVADLALADRAFAEARIFARAELFGETPRRKPVFLTDAELAALWAGSHDAPEGLAGPIARARASLEKTDDPRALADLVFDREELLYARGLAKSIGSDFIAEWTECRIRYSAALTVVRARLAGETPERLAEVFLKGLTDEDWPADLATEDLDRLGEAFSRGFPAPSGERIEATRAAVGRLARLIDDRLTLELQPAKCVTFGPERVFGYLQALRTENLNLRLITETFVVEGDRDETRRRLRASYV